MPRHEGGPEQSASSRFAERHLLRPLERLLRGSTEDLIDLGCGNGFLTGRMARWTQGVVVGVDRQEHRLSQARAAHPEISFRHLEMSEPLPDDLRDRFGLAVSTEVIEHLFRPREVFMRARESGASRLILSTPYHGYLKNLAIALTNGFDHHWQVNADFGHIKFFSVRSLTTMAAEEGWAPRSVQRIGRVPPLAKTMVLDLRRIT